MLIGNGVDIWNDTVSSPVLVTCTTSPPGRNAVAIAGVNSLLKDVLVPEQDIVVISCSGTRTSFNKELTPAIATALRPGGEVVQVTKTGDDTVSF